MPARGGVHMRWISVLLEWLGWFSGRPSGAGPYPEPNGAGPYPEPSGAGPFPEPSGNR